VQGFEAQGPVVYVVVESPEFGVTDIDSVWLGRAQAELRASALDHASILAFVLNAADGYLPGTQA
jgi:hypothetical protein